MRPSLHQERGKKAALLCMILGGTALIFGAVLVNWAVVAIVFSIACFITSMVLVLSAQSGGRG